MGTQVPSDSAGSKRRLLQTAYSEEMKGGCGGCSAGTVPHIANLFTIYGGVIIGVLITISFLRTIPFEINFYYVATLCIAAGLLITSQIGVAVSLYNRGLLICFLLFTFLLLCAEVTVVTLGTLKLLENAPETPEDLHRSSNHIRYVLHLMSPLLNTTIAENLKRYEDHDTYETTFVYALVALGAFLLFLQFLAIILALMAVCQKRENYYEGKSTLQRTNSVYYERGPVWSAPNDLYANSMARWTD